MEVDVKRIPDIKLHKLFESKIYLITEKSDSLAQKKIIELSATYYVHMQASRGKVFMNL